MKLKISRVGIKNLIYRSAAVVAVVGLGLTIAPQKAKAIFGIGDITFDPTQAAHAIQQIAQFESMIAAARQNVEIIERNVMALAQKQTYTNLLNNTLRATGANASVYTAATLPLNSTNTPTTREQLASLTSVQLTDTTSQHTVELLNQIASWQSSNRSPVSQWQSSVYSHDPSMNTAAAQQNLTNMGLVQLYEQQQQQIAISGALAQQTALQNIRDRNADVQAMNFWQEVGQESSTRARTADFSRTFLDHQLYQ